jgi:hypothetical protein
VTPLEQHIHLFRRLQRLLRNWARGRICGATFDLILARIQIKVEAVR